MKHREFWIIPEDNVDSGRCYSTNFEGTIHVIDHAAYTDALKKIDELEIDKREYKREWESALERLGYQAEQMESAMKMLEEMAGAVDKIELAITKDVPYIKGIARLVDSVEKYRQWKEGIK